MTIKIHDYFFAPAYRIDNVFFLWISRHEKLLKN